MVETPPQGLGSKTLLLILLKYAWVPFVAVLGALIATFVSPLVPAEFMQTTAFLGSGIALLGILITLAVGWLGYLEYKHYRIILDESTFKTMRGIIETEEFGYPYRAIRDVKITRDILDQMLGISRLVVTIAGEDRGDDHDLEFPWLDARLAVTIRDELLQKSEIEQLHIASSSIQSSL